jgi:hypothetical protein
MSLSRVTHITPVACPAAEPGTRHVFLETRFPATP